MKLDSDIREVSARPLVSLLIPCWGCKAYIAETIRSALAQTYTPLEILVVEDRGDDGTYEEALKFSDPRLRVIRNERNFGQYGNKNEALRQAKGALIKYLDGDDLLEPDCVCTLVDAWKEGGSGVGVVFGQFTIIDDAGGFIARPSAFGITGRVSGCEVLLEVLRQALPCSRFGNVTPHLFERAALEAIGGFPSHNENPGDNETFMKLCATTDVVFVEKPVARYRARSGSMSSIRTGLRDVIDGMRMVDRLTEFFRSQRGLPNYIVDSEFTRAWKVWASAHLIFASYQLRRRGQPNEYDRIKQSFAEHGLSTEFRLLLRRRWPQFFLRALRTKLRRRLRLPQDPPLFNRRFRKQVAANRQSQCLEIAAARTV